MMNENDEDEVVTLERPVFSAILSAVTILVEEENINAEVKSLSTLLKVPGTGARFATSSLFRPLNPLLALHEKEPRDFRAAMLLVARKRANKGFTYTELRPLFAGESEEEKDARLKEFKMFAKDINAKYIASMRERMARVVKAENMMRPASSQLVGKSRLEFQDRLWKEWGQRRMSTLAAAAQAKGDRLTHKEQSELGDALRDTIDREIIALEKRAREFMQRK